MVALSGSSSAGVGNGLLVVIEPQNGSGAADLMILAEPYHEVSSKRGVPSTAFTQAFSLVVARGIFSRR